MTGDVPAAPASEPLGTFLRGQHAQVLSLWLAAVLRALAGASAGRETTFALAYNLERLASVPLVLAGFWGLAGVDLRREKPWGRAAMAGLVVLAGLVALLVARWTADAPFLTGFLSVTAPHLTAIFLAAA